jgi:hypothetical protein
MLLADDRAEDAPRQRVKAREFTYVLLLRASLVEKLLDGLECHAASRP